MVYTTLKGKEGLTKNTYTSASLIFGLQQVLEQISPSPSPVFTGNMVSLTDVIIFHDKMIGQRKTKKPFLQISRYVDSV